MTSIARRRDLIQGTINSIASLGYGNSTVQTLCDVAGLSRGLIGCYVKGKGAHLIEAFRDLCAQSFEDRAQDIYAAGDDPLQLLAAATTPSSGWHSAASGHGTRARLSLATGSIAASASGSSG